ncbi:MAG: BamA/TamA family outer membrane protein [Bacteroidales bacterium]|nr:BamA/TamA family outer membrane protein [Bacteroidales bacterium]MCF8332849.1 BamA/TamA family outer membrane protein [Bacteroidales bacterium]
MKKNEIQVEGEDVDEGDLEDFVQQEGNKRILGVWWFKPWLYQQLDKGETTGIKKWMKENLASPPVYYNPSMAVSSVDMMEQYLFSKGYFDAEVNFDTVENNNKATITYHASPNSPYSIKNIEYQFEDTLLRPYVFSDTVNSLIKEGDKYDMYLLDDERDRIAKNLRREGFYRFNKEYIRYKVDSSLVGNNLDVYVQLLPRKYPSPEVPDKMLTRSHKRYKINRVIIKPDKKVLQSPASTDTLELQYRKSFSDTITTPYTFIYDEPMRVKPKTYMRRVKVNPGNWYDFKNVQSTYDNLAGLGITRFVKIDFSEKKSPNLPDTLGLLDCNIDINRKPVHSLSVETEGTNTAGRPGLAGRLVYTNKNLFRGGEVFDISMRGALEAQGGTNEAENKFLIFNTIEGGIDASLTIPHFLLPVQPEFFARDYYPYTNINTGYNYQKRPDYVRYITNFSFGYRWRQSKAKKHTLTPLNINAVKIFTEPSFEERLQQLDKKYREQYTNHLLASLKYSFIYNTQNVRNGNDFFYLRSNFESSGIIMDFLSQTLGYGKQLGGYNTLFNIRYAQFLRTDIDFRYYHYPDQDKTLIFRSLFGIGVPYGNSDALPFEKGFYAGGANGMRGWRIRSLGPGGYDDTGEGGYDKIGDIQMEFNTEYRFPIYRFFEGALFVDAGNIWLLNKSKDYPKGHFDFDSFLKQMAVDAGFGLRLDFQFFTLRVDAAIPFRQPSEPAGNRWQSLTEIKSGDIFWNFGIGYPF